MDKEIIMKLPEYPNITALKKSFFPDHQNLQSPNNIQPIISYKGRKFKLIDQKTKGPIYLTMNEIVKVVKKTASKGNNLTKDLQNLTALKKQINELDQLANYLLNKQNWLIKLIVKFRRFFINLFFNREKILTAIELKLNNQVVGENRSSLDNQEHSSELPNRNVSVTPNPLYNQSTLFIINDQNDYQQFLDNNLLLKNAVAERNETLINSLLKKGISFSSLFIEITEEGKEKFFIFPILIQKAFENSDKFSLFLQKKIKSTIKREGFDWPDFIKNSQNIFKTNSIAYIKALLNF